jgi:hypothetical protein
MRRRGKLIVPLALAVAVAVVAVSLADGGEDAGGPDAKPGWTSYAPLRDGDRGPDSGPQAFGDRHAGADADVAGVVKDVKEAAVKEAPAVAEPIISRSEQAGSITAAQAGQLRNAAEGLAGGRSPRELAPSVDLRDWDVRVVIRDAFEALSRRAPRIAAPIIDEAVANGDITKSQAAEVRARIATGRGGGCRKGPRNRDVDRQVPLDSSV